MATSVHVARALREVPDVTALCSAHTFAKLIPGF